MATIRMYGPIDSWGGFWGISTKDMGTVLDALPDTVTQIILRINSPGGEVFEGVSILNMLRAHKAKVTAVVDGLAASAASVIAAGCADTVMSPGTQMMIHSPLVYAYGNAVELRKTAAVLDGIESSLVEIYTAKAGEKDWAEMLADDTWLNAADAVSLGLADRIAVIPDAGETETLGTPESDDFDVEDSVETRPQSRLRAWVAALSPNLPRSTEPGETNRKENVMDFDAFKAGLRERLGVTDAAISDEQLLAAVDESLAEQVEPTPKATELPAGFTAIDETVLADLQANARAGAEARAEQESARRDGIVTAALRQGRIAAASKDAIRAQLDNDEAGTVAFLATLPENKAVPVAEIGHSDDGLSADQALIAQAGWADTEEVTR
ncbi:head maturation protease, ClpP-related [Lysinibacter sp. HNR]|uniref:head maturation protease, ClpP-related n=1 Tax=Lysinibacter sp. HNR TaxID=3031408 RepID=UPI002435E0F6|nr:head maturation protease, ClpP-related [Lysinibacter sp. HNR]WGD38482.1 ATP-dependent Clp protease proteolytic subunit [Lysinibacter sp. HNR]